MLRFAGMNRTMNALVPAKRYRFIPWSSGNPLHRLRRHGASARTGTGPAVAQGAGPPGRPQLPETP